MVQLQEVGVEFPVVLYNGERQINVGNIEINPTMIDFQKFRTMLKHMIGISYNNLTAYLVESRRSSSEAHSDNYRKILITSKSDFKVLVREKNAYFLVVLKRSRRDRRRKNNSHFGVDLSPADLFDYSYENHYQHQNIRPYVPECGKVEFWLQELEMQRANRMNFMIHDVNCDVKFDSDVNASLFPSVKEAYLVDERLVRRAACEECTQAISRGLNPLFHLCVYDDVVDGFFRSTAGPVCRP